MVKMIPPISFPPRPARFIQEEELFLLGTVTPTISGNSYVGPSNVGGNQSTNCGFNITSPSEGWGGMPWGDGFEQAEFEGPCGDQASYVGEIVMFNDINYQAFKSRAWGASTLITNNLKDARHFVNSATGKACREVQTLSEDGTIVYKFYNDSYASGEPEEFGWGS
jgi:hypothetical protein